MATFQEIADKISTEINQGTTLDAIILVKVYEAHRFMENNNNFLYMQQERELAQAADDLTITLTTGTKRVEMIRFPYEDEFKYLRQIGPTELGKVETDYPRWFYLVGVATAQMYKAFDEETTLTIIETIKRQSYVPAGTDWMTTEGKEAVKYIALTAMAGPARDPELGNLYAPDVKKALETVLAVDDELRRSVEDNEARYG